MLKKGIQLAVKKNLIKKVTNKNSGAKKTPSKTPSSNKKKPSSNKNKTVTNNSNNKSITASRNFFK